MKRIALSFCAMLISLVCAIVAMPPLDSHGAWKWHTINEIADLNSAVKLFAQENGHIPSQEDGLAVLVKHHILRTIPKDLWKNDYIYKVPDPKKQAFLIYSAGPNKIDDSGLYDDVIVGPKDYQCELYDDCFGVRDYVFIITEIGLLFATVNFLWQLLQGMGVFLYKSNRGQGRP